MSTDTLTVLDETSPQPAAQRRHERWPYDDVKRVTRAADYVRSRRLAFAIICLDCETRIEATGIDNAGNTLVTCACTERVWER